MIVRTMRLRLWRPYHPFMGLRGARLSGRAGRSDGGRPAAKLGAGPVSALRAVVSKPEHHRDAPWEGEERFRLVAAVTREAIWDSDLTTGAKEWDGATETLFGYPSDRGKTSEWWEGRVHPDDRGRVLSGLRAALEGPDELWEEGYRFRRADGSYAHVLDRGIVVRDPAGEPVRMVGAIADVTERKRHEEGLRRSEELFRMTFEAAAVGMAHVSPEGRWLRVNEAFCEISGYARAELMGGSPRDLSPPEDLETGEERVRRLLDGRSGSYSEERRYVRKDGSRVWVDLSVSLVSTSSGAPDYLACVAEDVTARKLAELLPDPLTGREISVLRLMAAGRKNGQIAQELSYSLGTVKLDVRNVLAKLRAKNRRRAAAWAVDIGLIPPAC